MTKLRFWDRIWSALMGILCFVLAASLVLYAIGLLPVQQIKNVLSLLTAGGWQRWVILAACVLVLALLGLRGIGMLFRRRKDKGFVIQRTEYGDMSISMKAMENMVKKCVDSHGELTVNNTKIYLVRNGVSVDLKITLASGVNIPLTVNALQKQIKQYITSCSGVDVHEVRVKVETDAVKLLPPPQTPVIEPAPVEEIKHVESPVEPMMQHKEEPAHYTELPVAEETAPASAEVQPEEVVEEKVEPEQVVAESAEVEETQQECVAEVSTEDVTAEAAPAGEEVNANA